MKKKNKSSRHYTFMFFPEGSGNPVSLRVHRYTIYLTVVSLILIFAGLLVLLFKTGETTLKLQMTHNLKQENQRLREQSRDLEISAYKIASIDSLTVYLHRLASIADIGGAAESKPGTAAAAPAVPVAPTVPAAPAAEPARPGAPVVEMKPGVQPRVQTEAALAAQPEDKQQPAVRREEVHSRYIESIPNIMPVDGWATKIFSGNPAAAHQGLDIAAASGTPIRVTAKGVVESIRDDRYYGLLVEVRHDNGFITRYAHCSQILVSAGEQVKRGQTIALVGSTGRSTAPHLHYEVMKSGKYVDPMNFIGARNVD